jgi:hypothetical protein
MTGVRAGLRSVQGGLHNHPASSRLSMEGFDLIILSGRLIQFSSLQPRLSSLAVRLESQTYEVVSKRALNRIFM